MTKFLSFFLKLILIILIWVVPFFALLDSIILYFHVSTTRPESAIVVASTTESIYRQTYGGTGGLLVDSQSIEPRVLLRLDEANSLPQFCKIDSWDKLASNVAPGSVNKGGAIPSTGQNLMVWRLPNQPTVCTASKEINKITLAFFLIFNLMSFAGVVLVIRQYFTLNLKTNE